jgi:hypothetical protein
MIAIITAPEDIDLLKKQLARSLPQVKSSHRVEAMARGLGWGTNAALRVSLKKDLPVKRVVNDQAFVAYLQRHGYGCYADSLAQAIQGILERG